MDFVIRKAGLDDLELLAAWRMKVLREVFAAAPDALMDRMEQENRRYYERAVPSGEHVACFACAGQQIAGCGGICFYEEMPSPDNPRGGCAYLMNIYTAPAFRGRGAGQAAVRWLIRQARERGTAKIYLETTQAARALYQKLGFREMRGYLILE